MRPIANTSPISLSHISGFHSFGLTSGPSTRLLDEVVVEFYLGDRSSGVNCTTSHGTSRSVDSRTSKVRRDLENVPPSGTHSLRGSWISRSVTPLHLPPAS